MNPLTPETLEATAREHGIRCLAAVPDGMLDPDLVADIPVEWARGNRVLPIRWDRQACLLTAAPDDLSAREYVTLLLGEDLEPVLATAEVILHCIERCYVRKDDSPGEFLQDMRAGAPVADAHEENRSDDLLSVTQNAPVTQLLNLILLEAVKRGASDIHFEPFQSKLRVRYRVDGVLYEQAAPPKTMEESVVSRLKVMARLDISERRLPQDGMARVRVGEREVDIRVSTIPVAEGERVVLRLLDRNSSLLPLEVLGMAAATLSRFNRVVEEPNGMIVVCGPTGSGKTTTLYAALSRLDASRKNIMTIEEPIEYQLADIGQIQVKPKIGLTFASGLRHILRQDPDIVLVGETRDLETAEIAIRASLTGHLVFTTLHTNDAPGTVVRLLDMGVEPYLIASCLKAALAQRLVRRLCDKCRRLVPVSRDDALRMGAAGARLEGQKAWEAMGCAACLEGYRGRVGIFELMVVDPPIQDMIRAPAFDSEALGRQARAGGMADLVDDAAQKVLSGATSLSELRSVLG